MICDYERNVCIESIYNTLLHEGRRVGEYRRVIQRFRPDKHPMT